MTLPVVAPPGAATSRLSLDLDRCETALAEHMEAVGRRYGANALGVVDLPPLRSTGLVPEQIRVCGVLYWASEVDGAGLLRFVEALAEGVVRGTVVQPMGRAVHRLAAMWRQRERRFSALERQALFTRVFGDAEPGRGVPGMFRELVGSLTAIGRAPRDLGTAHLEARIAAAARDVGGRLSAAGVGIAGFAARDLVAQARAALGILRDPDLVHGLGGGSPWDILIRHAPRLLGSPVNPQPHLARATAGFAVIDWIASRAAAIEGGTLRLHRADPVVRSAEAWSVADGVG